MPEPHVGAKRKFQNKPSYQTNCTFSLHLNFLSHRSIFETEYHCLLGTFTLGIRASKKLKKQNGVKCN